jgi:hypothetical protein
MRSQLPIPKIINGNVPGPTLQTTNCSFDVIANKCLSSVIVTASVTVLATGAATKSIPTPAMGISQARFVIGATPQRMRNTSTQFGRQGLSALNDPKDAGEVQYFQAGAVVTAAVNGITFGATPVLLGSAADLAIQAALANNTDTTAVFRLPYLFAEDFRKDVLFAEIMALPVAYGDANGNVTGTIGPVFFQLDIPALSNAAGGVSAVAISASEVFDERLLNAGVVPKLLKEKIYQDTYATGDVELADQFTNTDRLQRVSFLTVSDPITKFVVKQGQRIIRQSTWEENLAALRSADFNVDAIPRNRLDIEFDVNDDPSGSLPILPNQKLSIVCTFGSSADANKQVTILPSFYGPVE